MDQSDLIPVVAFILNQTTTLVKSASNVVRIALLCYSLAHQALECINNNKNIQEQLDFLLAESLSSEQEEEEECTPSEPKKEKDLKSMLDDPNILKKFEQYTRRFLAIKDEREKMFEVVRSIQEGHVDFNKWVEIETTVLSLVELDQSLFDMFEKVLLRSASLNDDNDSSEEIEGFKEHERKAGVLESGTDINNIDIYLSKVSANSKSPLPGQRRTVERSGLNKDTATDSFLYRVLDPSRIKEAADEMIAENPDRRQEIVAFIEKVHIKCQLRRQLEDYKFWVLGGRGAARGIGDEGSHGRETGAGLNAVVSKNGVGFRNALISSINELLSRKEEESERFGAEFGEGKHWMVGEVEKYMGEAQRDVIRMLERSGPGGDDDSVERIIQGAIDIEQKISGNSKLQEALRSGREALLYMLIGARVDHKSLALEVTAMLGFDKTAKDLLKIGAMVSDRCLEFAMTNGHADVLRTLLSSGNCLATKGEKLLSDALISGRKDVVKTLLEFGARITDNEMYMVSLRSTVEGGNLECLEALLSAGPLVPNVNISDLAQLAARRGHVDLYRFLIGISSESGETISQEALARNYEAKLPFSELIDYNMSSLRVDKHIKAHGNEPVTLDQQFPVTTEIAWLPGYGNVFGIPQNIATKCSRFCSEVIRESVDNGKIDEYEFPLTLLKCGSSAEGTKTGLPDEMDFLFLLHTDPDTIVIKDRGHGYKKIESAEEHKDTLRQKLISAGSKLFHDAFIGLVMTQKNHQDKIRSAQKIVTVGGSASSEWVLRYDIDADHSLDISVDLVPVVHILAWPSDAVQRTWMMDRECLESEGYALVAKPPSRKSNFGETLKSVKQERTWRISFAHLETRHLAMLDQRIKDVYVTCKSLRDADVSGVMFKDKNGKFLSTSKDLVTSYMLKMVFMHNVESFLRESRSLVEMVHIVYNQVACCIAEWFVPFFWQPRINVLEGLKQDPSQCKQAAWAFRALALARFIRDGDADTAETEDVKHGGVYLHLPSTKDRIGNSTNTQTANESRDEEMDIKSSNDDTIHDENDFCEVLIYSRMSPMKRGYTVYHLD